MSRSELPRCNRSRNAMSKRWYRSIYFRVLIDHQNHRTEFCAVSVQSTLPHYVQLYRHMMLGYFRLLFDTIGIDNVVNLTDFKSILTKAHKTINFDWFFNCLLVLSTHIATYVCIAPSRCDCMHSILDKFTMQCNWRNQLVNWCVVSSYMCPNYDAIVVWCDTAPWLQRNDSWGWNRCLNVWIHYHF